MRIQHITHASLEGLGVMQDHVFNQVPSSFPVTHWHGDLSKKTLSE